MFEAHRRIRELREANEVIRARNDSLVTIIALQWIAILVLIGMVLWMRNFR